MRILISGGTGFIGSLLLEKLTGQDHQCVVLSRGRHPEVPGIGYVQSLDEIADEDSIDAVINLALPESDRAIADEGSIIAGLGMHYVHLPVQMENPTLDNLRTFIGVMRALDGKKVWVHCVVNARVSAFVFHYLRKEKNLPEQDARSSILDQWEPKMDVVWKAFLAIPTESLE